MAIYLDYAAATPVDTHVQAAMQPFLANQFYNPSALYGPAVAASHALDTARADVAAVLGAKPSEIIFTAGGTEANNLAILGVEGEVMVSAIEHVSVRGPANQREHQIIPVNAAGLVDADKLIIGDKVGLISVMYANNEVGTVQPIKRISAVVETVRRERAKNGNPLPLYFHVDAAQAGNYLDMHVHRLGVDLMTINGGKLYGPKQTGALFVRSGIILKPLVHGGGQERNLRSGTENVAGAVGFAKALQISVEKRHEEARRLTDLQNRFFHLLEQAFPSLIVNGSRKHRLPNNVHITLPNTDNERVLMNLDMEDIYAAAGSACSASHDEPSHVLQAMGVDEASIRSSLRFSLGRDTTLADIEHVVAVLSEVSHR